MSANLYLPLHHLKRNKKKLKLFDKVFIWSDQWQYYWRDDAKGYTEFRYEAGVFPIEEAWQLVEHLGNEKKIILIDTRSHHNPLSKHY